MVERLKDGKSLYFLAEKEGKKWLRYLKGISMRRARKIIPMPMVKQIANWI